MTTITIKDSSHVGVVNKLLESLRGLGNIDLNLENCIFDGDITVSGIRHLTLTVTDCVMEDLRVENCVGITLVLENSARKFPLTLVDNHFSCTNFYGLCATDDLSNNGFYDCSFEECWLDNSFISTNDFININTIRLSTLQDVEFIGWNPANTLYIEECSLFQATFKGDVSTIPITASSLKECSLEVTNMRCTEDTKWDTCEFFDFVPPGTKTNCSFPTDNRVEKENKLGVTGLRVVKEYGNYATWLAAFYLKQDPKSFCKLSKDKTEMPPDIFKISMRNQLDKLIAQELNVTSSVAKDYIRYGMQDIDWEKLAKEW